MRVDIVVAKEIIDLMVAVAPFSHCKEQFCYIHSHSYIVYMLRSYVCTIYVSLFVNTPSFDSLYHTGNDFQYHHHWWGPALLLDIGTVGTTVGAFLWIQKELERKVLKTYNLIKYSRRNLFTMLYKIVPGLLNVHRGYMSCDPVSVHIGSTEILNWNVSFWTG